MARYLFLLMLLLPVVEIYILVAIGHATSFWVPFAIVIGSIIAGTTVARHEGLRVLERMREDMQRAPNAGRFDCRRVSDSDRRAAADLPGRADGYRRHRTAHSAATCAHEARRDRLGCVGTSKSTWQLLARRSERTPQAARAKIRSSMPEW